LFLCCFFLIFPPLCFVYPIFASVFGLSIPDCPFDFL
jgi:hypothetical protein